MATIVNERSARRRPWWLKYLAVAGPGLIVAFADTEAGSVTTAAVSGAQFGMKLVLLQLLLIVPLFVIQEMTVRLGTISGKRARRPDPRALWPRLGVGLARDDAGDERRRADHRIHRHRGRGADLRPRRRRCSSSLPRPYSSASRSAGATSAPSTPGWRCVCSSCCSSPPRSPRTRRGARSTAKGSSVRSRSATATTCSSWPATSAR